MGERGNGDNSIFISYAHLDNIPLTSKQEGWITRFHRALETMLKQQLGTETGVWRDEERLQGNSFFEDVIVKQLPRVKLLVSVVSPRYVKSDWCLKELHGFYESFLQKGGVRIGDTSRIIKVVKTPVRMEDYPPEMQGMLGFNFYEEIGEEKHRTFDPAYGDEYEQKFLRAVDDLAQAICRTLQADKAAPGSLRSGTGKIVYVAETTSDLRESREAIRRELEQFGHTVIATQEFAESSPDYDEDIAEALEHSDLSVHLVGSRYGAIPEGATVSKIVLQKLMAEKQHEEHTRFDYILWMQPDSYSEDPRQQSFIDVIREDPHLLEVSLEELKSLVLDQLKDKREGTTANRATADTPHRAPLVYLIYDQRDRAEGEKVESFLFEQGIEVLTPLNLDDCGTTTPADIRDQHRENMCMCDAVLIFCGNTTERWLKSKHLDLIKAPGLGRSSPIPVKAFYLAPPLTDFKSNFKTHAADILHSDKVMDTEILGDFIAKVKREASANN